MGMGAEFENRTGEWEMNEILESLYRRKSVRAFTEEQISPEDREAILQAALQAPSAGCQLLYTILDITDQGKKKSWLSSATTSHLSQKPSWRWYSAQTAGNGFPFTGKLGLAQGSPVQGICCWQ